MNNAQRLALYERLVRLKDGNDEARQSAANAYFPDEYRRRLRACRSASAKNILRTNASAITRLCKFESMKRGTCA